MTNEKCQWCLREYSSETLRYLHELRCKKRRVTDEVLNENVNEEQQSSNNQSLIQEKYNLEEDIDNKGIYCLVLNIESPSYELLIEIMSKLSEKNHVIKIVDKTIIIPKSKYIKEKMIEEDNINELKQRIKTLEQKLDYYEKMHGTGMF